LRAALLSAEGNPTEKLTRKRPTVEVPAEPWSKADPAAMQRWQDMRFGLFIHWGPVSISGERMSWSRGSPTPFEVYDNLYKKFDAPSSIPTPGRQSPRQPA
jgi:hypothetical protein